LSFGLGGRWFTIAKVAALGLVNSVR